MTDRRRITASRYRAECSAIRLAGGVLLDAMKRCEEPHTRAQMKAAVDLLRDAHTLDFSDENSFTLYRPPDSG